ncbi:MAG TPA: TM2 domain-containing protein [Tenuifilaceae bacterium]|nr:TM2 domain-containing protein [Tenuifilaceae bacterium]HPE17317.1 TM2 domain-containing protein [Tenuifilaceae bacterium]HPJ44543.1 TM2 domain-containing protein [Tenuifilaceae bacterium]HPQ33081.1 TM2 domain-containing protein [Tenuifilaceae bacterium]HRX67625.1 TM2 domain-containing protein [Tenuifilaceae bacterium]
MKKILFSSVFVLCTALVSFSGNYRVDNVAVDNLFDNALEVSISEMVSLSSTTAASMATFESKDPVVATIVCFFVGGFGVHRHYLGTKGSMWAIYTFTCGGIFGVVPLVDFFVLIADGIVKDNISKYENNENFFMW